MIARYLAKLMVNYVLLLVLFLGYFALTGGSISIAIHALQPFVGFLVIAVCFYVVRFREQFDSLFHSINNNIGKIGLTLGLCGFFFSMANGFEDLSKPDHNVFSIIFPYASMQGVSGIVFFLATVVTSKPSSEPFRWQLKGRIKTIVTAMHYSVNIIVFLFVASAFLAGTVDALMRGER